MVTIKTPTRAETWTKCSPKDVLSLNDYNDIIYMNCDDAGWEKIPDPLPSSLQILICNRNNLRAMPSLPPTLHTLHANFNKLKTFPEIGHTRLESLKLSVNDITSSTTYIIFPASLRELDLCNNVIKEFNVNRWSDHLVELDLSDNQLVDLDPSFDDLTPTCKLSLDHNDFPCQKYNAYTVWLTQTNVDIELPKILRFAKWGIKVKARTEDPTLAAQLPPGIVPDANANREINVIQNGRHEQVPTFFNLEPALHRNLIPLQGDPPRYSFHVKPKINSIYKNAQNVHASSVQSTTNMSLKWLIDSGQPNQFAKELIKDNWTPKRWWHLSEWLKVWHANTLIDHYCSDTTIHSIHGIRYTELLGYMWNVIEHHKDRKEILRILRSEIVDSQWVCFTGRFTRTLNALSGFVEGVQIGINDKEQMQNRIVQVLAIARKTHGDGTQEYSEKARKAVKAILEEFNVPLEEQTARLDVI